MCCSVISLSFLFCSFSYLIYVQSTLHVVVNFQVFVFYNNNNQNDVYVCCHHDHKVIARVHSVHLMNEEQRRAAADPQT